MKEFYRFIASKDIREHLEKTNYEMNVKECAFVVYESMLPLKDKHEAYKRIIDTMEDVQLPDRGGSLHKALRTKIELDNILAEVFKQEDKAVYVYSYIDREEGREVYADWRRCLEEAFDWNGEAAFVRVEKKWITVADECRKSVSVLFNADSEIVNVSSRGILTDELEDDFWKLINAGADAHIPMPFKKGDILHTMLDGVFVYEDEHKRQGMCGYKANELGEVGLCLVISPLDAEYYMEKLERKDKMLKDISLYLKGKIDLVRFIERCKS